MPVQTKEGRRQNLHFQCTTSGTGDSTESPCPFPLEVQMTWISTTERLGAPGKKEDERDG